MFFEISNEFLRVIISSYGAEMHSITDAENTEYLWQGDPKIWKRHAPILFPIIGGLMYGRYSYNWRERCLPQHGFARDCEFVPTSEQSKTTASFCLKSEEGLRGYYPFDFALTVGYALDGKCIIITHKVENLGAERMFFSIGEHPGFSLKLDAGGKDEISDYCLEFEKKETASARYLINGWMDGVKPCLEDENVFELDKDTFIDGTYVFEGLHSKFITLKSKRHNKGVRVGFAGYPYLAIWSPVAAPFTCIEPWYGITDSSTESSVLDEKEGIIPLDSGKIFECSYTIEIL